MRKLSEGNLLYSPSDIVRFLESPFASWMERLFLEARDRVTPDEESEELKLIAEEGNRHETRFLETLRTEGRGVTMIDRSRESVRLTREAIDSGDEVIFQAHLASGEFAGYADFLFTSAELETNTYEIWDTKLARSAKPSYLVQLCCYAELLEGMGYERPECLRVALGHGEVRAFRTADYFFAYLEAKRAFLQQMRDFDPKAPPAPNPRADHGRWKSHAQAELLASDHLVQVAGITTGQIKKLQSAGIDTLTTLAETLLSSVPKLRHDVFERVCHQARLQMQTRQRQAECAEPVPPSFEVLPHPGLGAAQGLELLPTASPNDVFFDLEGYPLAEGGQGLEYLFGATHLDHNGEAQFTDWWAHSPGEEKRAFENFVDWAYARWTADPAMHIYHYAPYEVAAMKRLMGQYGTRETQVDDLLRHGVFVDLYQVVRQSIRLGEDSYSLKKVERLYMDSRDGDVKTAAASIVFYARWMESGQAPTWQESEILREIRDYNREDCDSTWKLAEWLRAQQASHGLAFRPVSERADDPVQPTVLPDSAIRRQQLVAKLMESAEQATTPDEAAISTQLAHLLEYHRREDKPVWWAMFERCGMIPAELVEDADCLGDLHLTNEPPVSIKRSTGFWFSFDPGQDTKLAQGDKAIMAPGCEATVTIEELDAESGRALLKVGNTTIANKLDGQMPSQLSLIPDEYVNPDPMPGAIESIASAWLDRRQLPAALRRLLLRQSPLEAGTPLVEDAESPLEAALRVSTEMDGGALCIQGPPGTGKTFTGAKVIVELLRQGKNVGVASNSHKAVLNLLGECAKLTDGLRGIKCGGSGSDPFFDAVPGFTHIASSGQAVASYGGGLIAGTAWLFARDDMAGALDFLVVDEAGQVALANLTAMSRVTTNLILLGDQMQLAQPVKGSHPGESGQSALSYYLDGHATIPPNLGIFLPETRRMCPAICGFISDTVYEGRLTSHPSAAESEIDGVAAGISFEPVEHDGNIQESDEEAQRVREIVEDLTGRSYVENGAPARPLSLDDILIVAPYNRQVRNLKRHLPDGARVGTVDKFQGQQAAVVLVSLGSSAGEFGSRGLSFLLDKNRCNVALSRAKCHAVLIADPRIANYGFTSLADMERVNLFCGIHHQGSQGALGDVASKLLPVDSTCGLSDMPENMIAKTTRLN
ncbi:MAG: TM0106 family RecB-like putative nuclease [Verrucomicrobiae bacterium]|nr:TM0106 family RecB-like putative nuclease [Verrucomicrobiae bacterium]